MSSRHLKYLVVLTQPLLVAIAFIAHGPITFLPLAFAFGVLPLLELLIPPDPSNLSRAEAEFRKDDRMYDYLVYMMLPIQYVFLTWFLVSVSDSNLDWISLAGRVSAMGLMCGVIGINVAHELGHRSKRYEQWMAKALLLTTLYLHFFIEHNRGHHKRVATPDDPATARKGQWLYPFLVRSLVGGYRSAWRIELDSLRRRGKHRLSVDNEMLRFQIIQVAFVATIAFAVSLQAMCCFLAAATFGIFLLEAVNYIEHYGLTRREIAPGKYERTMPWHSWNSDHILGRLFLFEVSRHSDHHYIASKKYQILEHYDNTPQMPTGYPGMMVLACLPPIWFWVMDPRVDRLGIPEQASDHHTSHRSIHVGSPS